MDFVDDEDLVAVARGRNRYAVYDDFANVVDLGVRSGVDFLNINRPRGGYVDARRASVARLGSDPLCAVQSFSQYPGGGRFAHAASAGEQICVMKTPGLDRVHQR